MIRARVLVSLTLFAALFLSAAVSELQGRPPGNPGAGGQVIAGPGHLPHPHWLAALQRPFDQGAHAVLISTDNDPGYVTGPAHFKMYTFNGVRNWDEAVGHLSSYCPNGTVVWLALSGHGSGDGGVATKDPNTHLSFPNLRDEHVRAIQAKLRPDARVILLGCHVGTSNNLINLARKLGRPVIANTGTVDTCNRGEGSWVEFRP